MQVYVKRIYEPPAKRDGCRVLVDRLWPRGVSKAAAHLDLWCKDLAPSTPLRQWYHADKTARFGQFQQKYRRELDTLPTDVVTVLCKHDTITLVTAVTDIPHSHIPTLTAFLEQFAITSDS